MTNVLMDTVVSQIAKLDSVAVMNLKEEIVMANALVVENLVQLVCIKEKTTIGWSKPS